MNNKRGGPEAIGDILARIFPSIIAKYNAVLADTVELIHCRCCGQMTLASELSPSGECPSCVHRLNHS